MSRYEVHDAAVSKARSLIKSNHYVLESDWSDAQPSTDDQNELLDRHDWDRYGEWFLAIDTTGNEQTKDRYGFVDGDFDRVHRSGLIAAKQRAAQNGHSEIEQAADKLLQLLDRTHA